MTEIENVTNQYIDTDFNLPDHTAELFEAENRIAKLRTEIDFMNYNNAITMEFHTDYFEKIVRVLDYIGNLSKPAFGINQEIEDKYFLKYKHFPALAKKLWQEHYENIHRPYNILKNRCYRMLNAIDDMYIHKFNKYPMNWKI